MMEARGRLRGLGPKLFASHILVTLVGTVTFLIAVSILAPLIFGGLMAGPMSPSHEMAMGEMMGLVARAFERTLIYSLLAAALAAAVTATLASLFVAQRIVRPLRLMRAATRRIAAGRYDERVPEESEDELGDLTQPIPVRPRAAVVHAVEELGGHVDLRPRAELHVLVVHAVTTARFGPVKPYLIETCPEIMLMIVPGTKNGEILRGPPSSHLE